jgi:uncharacterized protein (UPF0305 family)
LRSVIFYILFALISFSSLAQRKAIVEKSFSVREAFESPDEQASPAKASFTIPDSGRSSYLINIGLSWDWKYSRPTNDDKVHIQTFSPFVVFNRNSMIDNQQHSYKTGFDHEFVFGTESDDQNRISYVHSSLQYMRDKAHRSNSVILTSYYTMVRDNIRHPDETFFISAYKAIKAGSTFYYRFDPTAGLEWQQVFASKEEPEGAQVRIYANARGTFAWRAPTAAMMKTGVTDPNQWPKRLEFALDYTARINFINSVNGSRGYVPLFVPSLTYFPLLNDVLSLTLFYQSGADPIAGLAKQRFWQMALRFQL